MAIETEIAPEQVKPTIDIVVDKIREGRLQCELVEDEVFELTAESAYAILDLKTFKGERPVDDRHVQELFDEMANGRFRAEHVRIALCKVGAETYRINGQHTCWARTYMPKNYACPTRKLVYKVPNETELKKLYSVFDPAYSARSTSHLTKVLLMDSAAVDGVGLNNISRLAVGFKFWTWDNREKFRRQGHNELTTEINKNPELFQRVGLFYEGFSRKTPHINNRMGVIAAMFECFDKRPTLAEEFWKPVCDGLGLSEETDPRYSLMRWLQTHNVDAAGWKERGKKVTSAEEMYRVCINAWNRWRTGEKQVGGMRGTSRRVHAK